MTTVPVNDVGAVYALLLQRWLAYTPYSLATDGRQRCQYCDSAQPAYAPNPQLTADQQRVMDSYHHVPGCLWRDTVGTVVHRTA